MTESRLPRLGSISSTHTASETCRFMEVNSRKRNHPRLVGVDGGFADRGEMSEMRKGQQSLNREGMVRKDNVQSMDGCLQAETTIASPTPANTASPRIPRHSAILSAIFLSLLPVPAVAYPQPRNKGSRRDRRRSGDFTAVGRGIEGYGLIEKARDSRMDGGWKGNRRYQTLGEGNEGWKENRGVDGNVHVREDGTERQVQTSEVSESMPSRL